jgi:hypothetical protein
MQMPQLRPGPLGADAVACDHSANPASPSFLIIKAAIVKPHASKERKELGAVDLR